MERVYAANTETVQGEKHFEGCVRDKQCLGITDSPEVNQNIMKIVSLIYTVSLIQTEKKSVGSKAAHSCWHFKPANQDLEVEDGTQKVWYAIDAPWSCLM